MTNIYELENIECRYPKSSRTVLKIESLTIQQGEVVFFIGASGVGKSTILETLGLMNKTVLPNANSKFDFVTREGNRINLIQMWQKGDKALSSFRRNHLSFIFQQTNLFPYLTVHQNANIVQVIQGKAYVDANQVTKSVFKKLTLDFGKEQSPKVTNISGGQRQRVAFARAISTSYDVLFADEPTGNLDWYNADNLMGILQQSIKENKKTAIIVSHDITLALNYATSIVLIEKVLDTTNSNTFGLIGNKQIYKRTGDTWQHEGSNVSKDTLEQMLKSKIQQQSEFNNSKKI